MVLNPGFENDFEYWGDNNGFSIFSTNPHSGLKCAGIIFESVGYFDLGLNSDRYLFLQQGENYRFSIWVREKDTHDTFDTLRTIFDIGVVINGAFYWLYGDSSTHTPSETWKLVERYFTPMETDTAAYISIQIHGYTTSTESFVAVDDVSIKKVVK